MGPVSHPAAGSGAFSSWFWSFHTAFFIKLPGPDPLTSQKQIPVNESKAAEQFCDWTTNLFLRRRHGPLIRTGAQLHKTEPLCGGVKEPEPMRPLGTFSFGPTISKSDQVLSVPDMDICRPERFWTGSVQSILKVRYRLYGIYFFSEPDSLSPGSDVPVSGPDVMMTSLPLFWLNWPQQSTNRTWTSQTSTAIPSVIINRLWTVRNLRVNVQYFI